LRAKALMREARFGFVREGRESNDFDDAGLDHGSIEVRVGATADAYQTAA
jgi:hypothetical protein